MKQLKIGLASLLTFQLLLALTIFFSETQEEKSAKTPLISIEKDAINIIKIASEADETELIKKDGLWVLAKLEQLPADAEKVNSALVQLSSIQTNWPITTTTSSHERFELTEKKYQRKIAIVKDEHTVDTILLGSSPSFKKAHVRKLDDNNVYSLALNSYDFPAKIEDWLDKGLLAIKEQTKIKGTNFSLIKIEKKWSLEESNIIDSQLDESKAALLSSSLASLKVIGLAKNEIDFSSEDAITIEVFGHENKQFQFLKKENSYYVKRDDFPQVFTIGKTEFDKIAKISIIDLITKIENTANEVEVTGSPDPVNIDGLDKK